MLLKFFESNLFSFFAFVSTMSFKLLLQHILWRYQDLWVISYVITVILKKPYSC